MRMEAIKPKMIRVGVQKAKGKMMNEVMVDEKAHNSKDSNKSHNLPDFD
jgi:hypothetical protein